MNTGSAPIKPCLPRTVYGLGVVSFLNDLSSEMIYPLLPVFLGSVLGAGALALGLIEGIAEFFSSILKILSGILSDRFPRRKPLVIGGYTISGLLRPLIGIATSWPLVLLFRTGDRIGKGIRTAPRDALIADVTDCNNRGTAFGIQRGMDHAGAVVGPLVASALLFAGLSLRSVFLLAVIPAIAIIFVLLFGIREQPRTLTPRSTTPLPGHWKNLGPGFKRMLLAVLVFTLGNSADAFLLLRLSDVGVTTGWIAALWAIHHVVKMVAATFGGWMSDRVGRKPMVIAGWIWYAIIYLAFGLVDSETWLIAVFILYGFYFGLTEPTEKAWVADLVPTDRIASAYGWYNGAIGMAALPASILFGAIWTLWGPLYAFLAGTVFAAVAVVILLSVPPKETSDSV